MENEIGLSEMVAALRQELEIAQSNAEGERLSFMVEDIDIELQIAMKSSEAVKGGVKFWVLNSSAELADEKLITQKLCLKLKVSDKNSDLDVVGGSTLISTAIVD